MFKKINTYPQIKISCKSNDSLACEQITKSVGFVERIITPSLTIFSGKEGIALCLNVLLHKGPVAEIVAIDCKVATQFM